MTSGSKNRRDALHNFTCFTFYILLQSPFTIFYLLTAETLLCAGIGHSDADSTSLPSPASSAANTPGMITAEVVWRFGEYLQTPTDTYTHLHNV